MAVGPRVVRVLSLNSKRFTSSNSSLNAQPKTASISTEIPPTFELDGRKVSTDTRFNITPNLWKLLERRLLAEPLNPLRLLKEKIIDHFHKEHRKPGNRSPIFTICDNEPRLVSVFENFDSLLTPTDHVSRRPSDTYYISRGYCLRAHTSAHQFDCLKRGLDNFIIVGDVFRRDEIDRTHFPCFHQMEGMRTFALPEELFGNQFSNKNPSTLFASTDNERVECSEKQDCHSLDASKVLVLNLKQVLENLAFSIFGPNIEYRWVDAYFPFTHPSFELEVRVEGINNSKWLEVLGCGVVRQEILRSAGAGSKVGWAFGLGLERLAMALFGIPDIRLFWSNDTGFLNQFKDLKPEEYRNFMYRPISDFPQCAMDISFWIPLRDGEAAGSLATAARLNELKSDVRDVMRYIGGDLIEQLELIDEFHNDKKGLFSHCYRITYRSHEKVLTKDETNVVHRQIGEELSRRFGVILR